MYKLWQATFKEFLLIKRDFGGLITLFVMPIILVITVTLIQNGDFNKINDTAIPILFIDNDEGELSKSILANLEKNNSLQIITQVENVKITEEKGTALVLKGKYQLAIVIPENLSKNLKNKVSNNVSKIMTEMGLEENLTTITSSKNKQDIKLIFDPAAHIGFKNGVRNSIDKMISKIETQSIYSAFQKELDMKEDFFSTSDLINIKEINPLADKIEIKPNAAQHNVPAWTLFAIFFIILPLGITIVKEKNQGTAIRLKTFPTPTATILGGKIIVYSGISLLQFTTILLVGIYLFPLIGLPALIIEGSYLLLYIVAFFSGLAAIGLGILIGAIASTTEQAAPFGATLVVILAAIGGVWVPTFLMPDFVQSIAEMTPMNWGLNGFYDIILRNGTLGDILPEIALLGLFFITTSALAIVYDNKKNKV